MASLGAIRRVLSQRNAQIFYAGSLTSWTGLWMQRVATDWLAWQLTHSPLWVGVMAFCNLGPSVIASPIAGAVADRVDRVRMTMVTQLISAAHASILVTLILTGLIRIEIMAALEVCLGLAQAFSQPARQCLVPGLVPRADLPSAVALNSLCFNLARFVGPALSGPLVALFGVVPPIALNCCAYLFASATMPLLRLPPGARIGHAATASVWREAADGIAYVARHGGMGPLMLFAAAIGMLMRSVPEMLSPFIAQLFSRGAEGLAVIASTMGLAALAGGMLVAARGRLAGLSGIAVAAGMLLVVGTVGFVATPSFHVAVGCAAAMGAATTVHGIAIQTLLQNAAAPHMIGRVLSLWGMIVRAAPALGALTYGAASLAAGLRVPVMAGGVLCVLAWLWARTRLPRMARELEAGRAA
jgi:MFS family permease